MDISMLRERASRSPMSISELNTYIKSMFDNNNSLSSVTVRGEISNFKNHGSGHLYFSLKDADSQIKAVMFRSAATKLKFMPEDGMKVTAHGAVSVYSSGGTYQLYVNSLQPDGIGALYLAYEQLKAKLEAEGLFLNENKKRLPKFPMSVGVITSPSGAAVRDIINVIGRRFPIAKIYVYPALVQGSGAEESLIKALEYFEQSGLADTVIIGRGGGSIEDLWAFNGERLARKIYEAKTPIISAVGHETDFTICDFVADMRAPTPSAAAELAVPDIKDLYFQLDGAERRIKSALVRIVEKSRERLSSSEEKINELKVVFFEQKRQLITEIEKTTQTLIYDLLKDKSMQLKFFSEKLDAMSPLAVLSRGYSYVEQDSRVINSVKNVSCGENVKINFSDGVLFAEIKKIIENGADND